MSLGLIRLFFGRGELLIKSLTAGSLSVSSQFLFPQKCKGKMTGADVGVD